MPFVFVAVGGLLRVRRLVNRSAADCFSDCFAFHPAARLVSENKLVPPRLGQEAANGYACRQTGREAWFPDRTPAARRARRLLVRYPLGLALALVEQSGTAHPLFQLSALAVCRID